MVTNAQALCKNLKDLGYKIVTDGTDNHIVLVDLRNIKLSGSKAERILEDVGISVNKNTVPGDKSAMNPSGMFIFLTAILHRGLRNDFFFFFFLQTIYFFQFLFGLLFPFSIWTFIFV